jgi:DNA-binding IclR family transcriptional regulator
MAKRYLGFGAATPVSRSLTPRKRQSRGMHSEQGPSVADRLFSVLESCASSPRTLTLADLVERTGLPKTTLHRTCWKLVELGALENDSDGFRIGTKLFALGSMSPPLRRVRVIGMPYLHELVTVTGRVANLAVLSDRRALLVEEIYGPVVPVIPKMVGATMPLHATAIGKALLMHRPAEEVDAIIGSEHLLRPYTPRTIVRPKLLREHLAVAERSGAVVSREEWTLGISGVAAPIVVDGETVAAIALIGPLGENDLRRLAGPVRTVAARFSGRLALAATRTAA